MAITRMTDQLKPGMTLDQDIYNRDRVLLLAKGAVLTEETIKTIKRLGYAEINVQKAADTPEYWGRADGEKLEEFKRSYEESGEEVVELIKSIGNGQQVDVDQAFQVPGSILEEIRSPYNLFPYMSQVDRLDHQTYGHSMNVSLICSAICQWLGMNEVASKDIVVAGLLHDVGKSRLKPDILYKSELTFKEQDELQGHTLYGFRMLEEANAPETARMCALLHHEREDGSGYPKGLTGDRIPLVAKIVAVADVFDTLNFRWSRGGKVCPFKVLESLHNDFLGLLDTRVLITFLTRSAECYVGELVRLSDGRTGQVVVINRSNPSRPMVRADNEVVDLSERTEIEIESIIPFTGNSKK